MIELMQRGPGGMDVRVHESGNHHLPRQVDDLRLLSLGLQHFVIFSDHNNPLAANGNRLRKGELVVDGHDLAAMQNQIRRLGGG